MAIDMGIARSRRALLAGGIGGLAAVVASALGRPFPARAGVDGDVVLGKGNTATTTTAVSNFTTASTAFAANCSSGHALSGTSSGSGRFGVRGVSNVLSGFAIHGTNTQSGAFGFLGGQSSPNIYAGAYGECTTAYGAGVRGLGDGVGVYGSSANGAGVRGDSDTSSGVFGISDSGFGVRGSCTSGVGVRGDCSAPSATAILGRSLGDGTGVLGFSGPGSEPAAPAKTGVFGYAVQDSRSHGVYGRSTAGDGVHGEATSGPGVYGSSTSGSGVTGNSASGSGVIGWSATGDGIYGYSGSNAAVLGDSYATTRAAIVGQSWGGRTGVSGFSGPSGVTPPAAPAKTGIFGYSSVDTDSHGVHGRSSAGIGVYGLSEYSSGVVGKSTSGIGTRGVSKSDYGVYGISTSSVGVFAVGLSASSPGAVGQSPSGGTGMLGFSGAGSMPAGPAKTGVYGYAVQDAHSRGIHGHSTAGRGVHGQATSGAGIYGYATSGAGLHGAATTGYALRTSGRLRVEKASGVATIAATKTSATVTPGLDVTSASFVLLTPRGNLGGRSLWYTIDAINDRFTIRVSSAVAADLHVGWLLLG